MSSHSEGSIPRNTTWQSGPILVLLGLVTTFGAVVLVAFTPWAYVSSNSAADLFFLNLGLALSGLILGGVLLAIGTSSLILQRDKLSSRETSSRRHFEVALRAAGFFGVTGAGLVLLGYQLTSPATCVATGFGPITCTIPSGVAALASIIFLAGLGGLAASAFSTAFLVKLRAVPPSASYS